MQLSFSGYKSAARYWPGVFAGVDSAKQLQVLNALARLRPVLVKGYEAMVMARSQYNPGGSAVCKIAISSAVLIRCRSGVLGTQLCLFLAFVMRSAFQTIYYHMHRHGWYLRILH